MCLTVQKDQKIKTATEDIYVLKYLHISKDAIRSPFNSYHWKLGAEQPVVKLHKAMSYWHDDGTRSINEGYYSWDVNKVQGQVFKGEEVFLCKIPKGTRYYTDCRSAQVCAEQLVVVEHIYSTKGIKAKNHEVISNRLSYEQRLRLIKKMLDSYELNTKL